MKQHGVSSMGIENLYRQWARKHDKTFSSLITNSDCPCLLYSLLHSFTEHPYVTFGVLISPISTIRINKLEWICAVWIITHLNIKINYHHWIEKWNYGLGKRLYIGRTLSTQRYLEAPGASNLGHDFNLPSSWEPLGYLPIQQPFFLYRFLPWKVFPRSMKKAGNERVSEAVELSRDAQ